MGVVALVDVDPLVAKAMAALGDVDLVSCTRSIDRDLQALREDLELVVVGSRVDDPVQITQRVFRLDPSVSVLILADDAHRARIRDALRFAPFTGTDVDCDDVGVGEIADRVERAAHRTRARRRHRGALGAINAKVTIEPAPLHPLREELATQVLDLAPVGIVSVDPERRVTTVNAEASRLLGAAERALLGHRVDEIEQLGADWSAALDASKTETRPFVIPHRTGDALRQLEVRATALSGRRGFLLVVQDVTEREQLARARKEAVERAELASRLKDEFLAVVSHELRTPLNAILGWTRILRSGRATAEQHARALETIDRNASAQAKLVEDLLDVSRMISGKMRLDITEVELDAVVGAALDSLRPSIAARGMRVGVTIPKGLPKVAGDAMRLQQIVWNLVSNSVKFSPKGGEVRIDAEQSGDSVLLRVADSGEGIPADALPFIFDPFRQAVGGTTRAHGGLGLGLAIVRRLAELHGGTVRGENGPHGGAVLTVTLPIAGPAREANPVAVAPKDRPTPPPVAPLLPLTGAVVLVVDDDPDALELTLAILGSAGARVHGARSVEQALETLRLEPRWSLVVSDIGMPELDGYALIARLRSSPGPHRETPAIAVTAYARSSDRERALTLGFQEHLSKPVDPDALIAAAQRAIVGRRG